MRRRTFIALAGASLAAPGSLRAQRRVPVVGVVATGSLREPPLQGLVHGLAALGYPEDERVSFRAPSTGDSYDALQRTATDLAAVPVDVLVTSGATATLAARRATATIPTVFITGSDPVQLGLISSLARPDGNMTGVMVLTQDLAGKRLDFLKEALPRMGRIAVLSNPDSRATVAGMPAIRSAASSLGLEVHSFEVRTTEELDPAFMAMADVRADALVLVPATMFSNHRAEIVALAMRHRLPAIYWQKEFVQAGGLMSYGTDALAIYRRAATYVDRILKGTAPADLPVEQASTFALTINLKTISALDLQLPLSFIARADEVIE